MSKEKQGYSSRKKNELISLAVKYSLEKQNKNKLNRYSICEELASIMEEKYSGDSLEYHSKRMGLDTTKKVLDEIDYYIYMNCA